MRNAIWFPLLLAAFSAAGACSDSTPSNPDAGSNPSDAGSGADAPTTNDAAPLADAGGNTDGAMDAGGDAAGSTIGAGPYSISYSAPGPGIDTRPAVTAVFSAGGELEGYTASVDEAPTRGTTKVGELYMDPFSTLGRWQDGTTAGKFYAAAPFTYNANQGFHYALVIGGGTLPTSAIVTYDLAAFTKPTIEDGTLAAGTVVSAKAAVQYSAAGFKTGIEISISIPGDGTYTASTTGGALDPSQSALGSFNAAFFGAAPSSNGGVACSGAAACNFNFRGYAGGAGANSAARLALTYVLESGSFPKTVRGAIVFKAK